MIKVLHFADAHIDMAAHGRQDPQTGLPLRVLDYLKALDTIVDTAIHEKVDLVIFAGDAYKDRAPAPTYQREWGRRIMRLSAASIPTFLLVGNHDVSPALGRAHTLQEFDTLEVPHTYVLNKPALLKPSDIEGLPLQIIALPWVSRSGYLAASGVDSLAPEKFFAGMESIIEDMIKTWLEEVDATLPVILTAHTSIQGAIYGGERSVMLGNDLVLSMSLVSDPRLDYVALGHIHKAQDLNAPGQPPVVYPGSIERVDFGEVADEKYFVIAEVEKAKTKVIWHKLEGRRFIDRHLKITSSDFLNQKILQALPPPEELTDAVVRLVLEYPRTYDSLIEETELRRYAQDAFEFHFIRRPQIDARIRIPGDQAVSSLTPLELLELFWKSTNTNQEEEKELKSLANEILGQGSGAADQPDARTALNDKY
jgi:DNA repair protein SbcD/Mre11